MFPLLSSPIQIGPKLVKNRLFMPAHDTGLAKRSGPSEEMIAYLKARAEGGVGMIMIQSAGVHESARLWARLLMADTDECIAGFRKLKQELAHTGVVLLGQLLHGGRLVHGRTVDGTLPVPWAPSDTHHDAYPLAARGMEREEIEEIIAAYGSAARRMAEADLDGVEITAAHGYLPWQFINLATNRREDEFGGALDNRLRFLRRCLQEVRDAVGPNRIVGLRISADDGDAESPSEGEIGQILTALDGDGVVDYFNLAFGNENSDRGAAHVIPPMDKPTGYVKSTIARLKQKVKKPVLAVGRINDVAFAERMLAEGAADMCGSARAMICDPEFARKAVEGRSEDVRACIACNQACVGHLEIGYSISCIQHPESGRELRYGKRAPAQGRKRVAVIGGGPAGMKAAAVAAERGHEVDLYEAGPQLGGQVLLAQLLPSRAEFGGLATNLKREVEAAGVRVRLKTQVTAASLKTLKADAIIYAAGAMAEPPRVGGVELAHVMDAMSYLRGEGNVGKNVVVYDWRLDWVGPGVAEKLAMAGCYVRLVLGGSRVGDHLQHYTRDAFAGRLHAAGVSVQPYGHLAGVDESCVYLEHSASGAPMVLEDVDTVILCGRNRPRADLTSALSAHGAEIKRIGDCLAPRTAEEAVFEGLLAGDSV